MSSQLTQKIAEGNVTIPTLPTVITRIQELLESESAGAREIGQLIAQDAPLATKVLRITNSAHYGLRERVISLEHASAVLGLKVLKNIVMQASVVSTFNELAKDAAFDMDALWRHSILTAQMSQVIAALVTKPLGLQPEEFYTCGLLHDLGKIVMLSNLGDEYDLALSYAAMQRKPLHETEKEVLGFNHAEVGAKIALRWGLPDGVVSAIQYHHGPQDEIDSDPAVCLIDYANRVASHVLDEDGDAARAARTDVVEGMLGVNESTGNELVEQAVERLGQIEL
jgi:putative nucleotidyltransferase with HDIG domain